MWTIIDNTKSKIKDSLEFTFNNHTQVNDNHKRKKSRRKSKI